jgi:hypothetical protein
VVEAGGRDNQQKEAKQDFYCHEQTPGFCPPE